MSGPSLVGMEGGGGVALPGADWAHQEAPLQLNRTLVVAAFHDPPIFSLKRLPDGSVSCSGYLFELWRLVARQLQLSYRIVEPRTAGYGMLSSNGSWNGLMAELVEGRADLALTWMVLTPQRAAAVDFLSAVPVELERPTFVVRLGRESVLAPSLGVFASLLRPLSAEVWWTLAASLLVLSVVLRVTQRLNSATAEDGLAVRDMGWGSCLFASLMTVAQQGWHRTPHSLAGRTATLFGWLMGILIYVNYTANLMSFLTVNTARKPISSVREFVQQPDWFLAMQPTTFKMNELASSGDAYDRQLYERAVSGDRFIPIMIENDSIRHVFGPKIMTFTNLFYMEHWIGNEACSFVPLQDTPVESTPAYLVMAKGNPDLKRQITKVLISMSERGVISRLMTSLPGMRSNLCEKTLGGYNEISIDDVVSVLCLVPLGIVISLVVLGLELLLDRYSRPLLRRALRIIAPI